MYPVHFFFSFDVVLIFLRIFVSGSGICGTCFWVPFCNFAFDAINFQFFFFKRSVSNQNECEGVGLMIGGSYVMVKKSRIFPYIYICPATF